MQEASLEKCDIKCPDVMYHRGKVPATELIFPGVEETDGVVFVIGMNPGEWEVKLGQTLIGSSGLFIRSALKQHFRNAKLVLGNVVKCRQSRYTSNNCKNII